MIDFNSTKASTSPELRPHLSLLAAVITQAISDAGAVPSKDIKGGCVTSSDVTSSIYFLFEPGRLEPYADMIGFDADMFRAHLICGKTPTWAAKGPTADERERIRARAVKYGFTKEVHRLDDIWEATSGRTTL